MSAAVVVHACALVALLYVVKLLAGIALRPVWDWWLRNRDRRISTFFRRNRGLSDVINDNLRAGYVTDGAHDRDDDLEPGLRVCEVDMLERLWELPARRVKS